jgi:ATP-binding cassette subfamily C protein
MKEFKKFFIYFKDLVFKENKFRFLFFIFLTLLNVQFATLTSLLVKEIVDKGIIEKNWNFVIYFSSLTLLFWFISISLSFISTMLLRFLRNRIESKLRLKVLKSFFSLKYEFISSHPPGYFLSRIFDEPDSLLTNLLNLTSGAIINLFWIILGFLIGLYLAPQLSIFIIPFFLLQIILNYKVGRKFKFFVKERNEKSAILQGYLNSLIENYKSILVFEGIEYITKKFQKKLKDFLAFLTKTTLFTAGFNNFVAFLQMTMQVGLLILAGFLILKGKLSIGSYFGFSTIIWQLLSAIEGLYDSILGVRECVGEIERLEEISPSFDKPLFSLNFHKNEKIIFESVEIKLDRKIIRYPNFEIKKGEKVIIFGDNGTGKTTLLYTICGFYPYKGKISSFSHNVSISFAPPLLFEGTLLENLEIVNGYNEEKLHYLLKIFNLEGCKEKDTKFLSLGEKKKVDIIRAFLKESDIYLIDEPFTSLDEEGKEKFLNIIKELYKEKTIIVTSPSEIVNLKIKEVFDKIIKL